MRFRLKAEATVLSAFRRNAFRRNASESPTRIPPDDERLRVRLAVDGQPHRVGAGRNRGAAAAESTAAATGATAAPAAGRRRAAQIPDPAMHAGGRGQRLTLRSPDRLNVQRVWIPRLRAIVARETADGRARA